MTDHDRQFPRVGHSTTGEAGGASAGSQNGRHVAASPPSEASLPPVRSGRYGAYAYSDATIWQRGADKVKLVALCAALGAGFAVGSSGCGKVGEASAGSAAAAREKDPSSPPQAPSKPSIESDNYRAEMRPSGPCKKDQTCTVEVLVEAKGDYHINDKYPYKFKLEDPPPQGMKYPKPVVGKEDAAIEERRAVLKVPFVSDSAGNKKVAGILSLSVCSAANCLMDKQPLEVTVKVE
jgi:hypothetical protein